MPQREKAMGQCFNGLSSLEREALTDYATEKYFSQPAATRANVNEWISNFTENMARNERSKMPGITRDYAVARAAVSRS